MFNDYHVMLNILRIAADDEPNTHDAARHSLWRSYAGRLAMTLAFKVFIFVGKPVEEVYEAVADPEKLSHYFTTGGAVGRLQTGAVVQWDFHDFPGAFPVE